MCIDPGQQIAQTNSRDHFLLIFAGKKEFGTRIMDIPAIYKVS